MLPSLGACLYAYRFQATMQPFVRGHIYICSVHGAHKQGLHLHGTPIILKFNVFWASHEES